MDLDPRQAQEVTGALGHVIRGCQRRPKDMGQSLWVGDPDFSKRKPKRIVFPIEFILFYFLSRRFAQPATRVRNGLAQGGA